MEGTPNDMMDFAEIVPEQQVCPLSDQVIALSIAAEYNSVVQVPMEFMKFHEENIQKSEREILDIAISTVDQSKNSVWHEIRSVRITSSKAHRITTRSSGFLDLALDFRQRQSSYAVWTGNGTSSPSEIPRNYSQ